MGFLDNFTQSLKGAVVSAGTSAVKTATLTTTQMELQDLIKRYDECYLIIGKRIAEFLRNGDAIDDPKVNEAFARINAFDKKRNELEATISQLAGERDILSEAPRLADVEREVEREIENCKRLLRLGVDSQAEYDNKVAVLQNRVASFRQLNALDKALASGLIAEPEYRKKRAAILSKPIES